MSNHLILKQKTLFTSFKNCTSWRIRGRTRRIKHESLQLKNLNWPIKSQFKIPLRPCSNQSQNISQQINSPSATRTHGKAKTNIKTTPALLHPSSHQKPQSPHNLQPENREEHHQNREAEEIIYMKIATNSYRINTERVEESEVPRIRVSFWASTRTRSAGKIAVEKRARWAPASIRSDLPAHENTTSSIRRCWILLRPTGDQSRWPPPRGSFWGLT